MAEKNQKVADIKDVEQPKVSDEQIREYKQNMLKMFKDQTHFYEQQAKYEEALTRVAVARRDRLVAEYEIAKIMAEQKHAEEEYNKAQEKSEYKPKTESKDNK